jgi:hypothetical protein
MSRTRKVTGAIAALLAPAAPAVPVIAGPAVQLSGAPASAGPAPEYFVVPGPPASSGDGG